MVDGEAVIVTPQDGDVKILNSSGSRVWELLDGTRSTGQISEIINTEFNIAIDVASDDIKQFLTELETRSLIKKIGNG